MNLSPSIPWALVPVGAVVMAPDNVPRSVMLNDPIPGTASRAVLLFGLYPDVKQGTDLTTLVHIDDADAVANLRAAGFQVEVTPS